jgi:hypothetical protein
MLTKQKVGHGDLVPSIQPSSTMAFAPEPRASAGWNSTINVPLYLSLSLIRISAAVRRHVICISWPHACITGRMTPSVSSIVTLLEYGRPVSSKIGRASMSARTKVVLPGPFLRTPTRPWPPILVVISKAWRRDNWSAIVLVVQL